MHDDVRLAPFHFGSNVVQAEESGEMSVFHMQDKTGYGAMTIYHVFPGIFLMYNDFHMTGCFSEFRSDVPLIEINHCCEGRIEWELDKNFLYIQEGDLHIDSCCGSYGKFGFPLNHYHGITISINLEEIHKSAGKLLSEFEISVDTLYQQFCTDKTPYIKHADELVSHIFTELYSVKEEHRIPCYRVKILELLLYLQMLDPSKKEERTYFPKRQVDIVKEIAKLITDNLDKRYSIEELSKQFDISATTLKLCFRGVFGSPIGRYLREYRMNEAGRMLKNGEGTVSMIAGRVGYDNQSKFAAAFKDVMGVSPKEYSKICV